MDFVVGHGVNSTSGNWTLSLIFFWTCTPVMGNSCRFARRNVEAQPEEVGDASHLLQYRYERLVRRMKLVHHALPSAQGLFLRALRLRAAKVYAATELFSIEGESPFSVPPVLVTETLVH
jgi:hypothetical protein